LRAETPTHSAPPASECGSESDSDFDSDSEQLVRESTPDLAQSYLGSSDTKERFLAQRYFGSSTGYTVCPRPVEARKPIEFLRLEGVSLQGNAKKRTIALNNGAKPDEIPPLNCNKDTQCSPREVSDVDMDGENDDLGCFEDGQYALPLAFYL
jgi:hypothetical protein